MKSSELRHSKSHRAAMTRAWMRRNRQMVEEEIAVEVEILESRFAETYTRDERIKRDNPLLWPWLVSPAALNAHNAALQPAPYQRPEAPSFASQEQFNIWAHGDPRGPGPHRPWWQFWGRK